MAIPPPPDEATLFGNNASTIPPPPAEAELFNTPKSGGQITSQGNGNLFGPGGRIDRLGHLMHGEFESAVMNGFGGFVARKGYELAGVPKDQVNAAVLKARQDAQNEIENSGSQGFNPLGFASAVVGAADPTYLINPGAGAAKNLGLKGASKVAARVVANTGSHAVMGSGADAAYQLADEVDGLQKGFDIKRNLTAAGTMAGFGAAHAGIGEAAPVVSQFVQDLFKKRGVDTTPPEVPTGKTTPLTGQGLTPEELQAYHQVLQTGDEHEIRGFFNGRNVQPPSFADAHEWVSRRDAVQQGHAPSDYADPMFHPEPGPVDMRPVVEQHIAEHTASWKNAPEFEAINSVDDIQDPAVRQAALDQGADHPDALGFLGPDGKVRIFASRLGDNPEATLNAVVYHEALGHFGLAQKFGDNLDAKIGNLLKRNVGQFGKDVDAWQKANPDAYNGDRIRAAEEVLAEMSQNGTLKPSLSDAIVSHMRQFGRKMGLKLSYSDAEVRQILNMAHQAVISGNGRNVRANGFRYMFTGDQANTFDYQAKANADKMLAEGRDPEEVRKLTGVHYAGDNQARMEISDDGAHLRNEEYLNHDDEQRLGNVLHHPRLYDAYPHLEDMPVKSYDMGPGVEGGYEPADRTIHINTSNPDKLNTILHETQHAVQHIEGRPGMGSGAGSMAMSAEEYAANPLEKEAYATGDRMGLSGMERRETTPVKFMKKSDLSPEQQDYIKDNHESVPDILYHGRSRDYTEIDMNAPRQNDYDGPTGTDTGWFGKGFYMSPSPRVASGWANSGLKDREGSNVLPLIASIKNPLIIDIPEGDTGVNAMGDALGRLGAPVLRLTSPTAQTRWLKARGYDGVVARGGLMGDEVVAFDPEQIKSVFNRGLDTGNRFMRREQLEPKDVAEEAYQRLEKSYVPRGTGSWKEAKTAAEELLMSPEAIKNSRSVGDLQKKVFMYGEAAKQANAAMLDAQTRVANGETLSAEDHASLIEHIAQYNFTTGRLDQLATQMARGLNAMKAVEHSRNNLLRLQEALKSGETNLEALADPSTMIKFLNQYASLANNGNPVGAAQLLNGVTKPYWWQYLLSWRQNMMLSGLSTHLKSTMDMATTAGRDIEEKLVALPAGTVRSIAQSLGLKVQDGIHPTDVAAHLWGLTRASLDGKTWADAGTALKNGNKGNPRYANRADPDIPIANIPTKMIAAQDSFFRSVLTNANLYELGAQKARADFKASGKSFTADDVMTAGAANARSPTTEMLDRARELTENTMLLNRAPLNSAVDKARSIRPGMSGWEQTGSFVANALFPFIRVQANALMNQIVRRSPLSFLDPVTRADWAAGGARRDVAIARTLMGSAILAYYWNAAGNKDKVIANGPDNYQKLRELEAGGLTTNSIHEDGRYNRNSNINLSLNPFDLHNNTATTIAGIREAMEKGADSKNVVTMLQLTSQTILNDLASQTFIGELAPFVDALTTKGTTGTQKASQFVGDELKSFLPNVTTQAAKMIDPNRHDVRDNPITGAVLSSIPGASQGLPIRYNVYGEPEKTGTSLTGVHTVVPGLPGNGQQEVTDPTEKELSRLAGLTKAAIVTPTQRTIKVQGYPEKLKLTASQAEDYQKYTGQTIVGTIRDQMQSGEWAKLSDQDKVNTVREIQKQAKSQVRDALLQQPGWLNKDQLSNLRSQAGGQ